MTDPVLELTEDAFLGGQLRLKQLRSGHRAGHDAVLLAAATAARPGDRIADLGAGAGVAGLAVARRLAGIDLVLVEIDAALAGLARANADANAIAADVIVLDVEADAAAFAAAGLAPDSIDAVLMNPPFNDPARHRISPDTARGIAHMATATTLSKWVHAARRILYMGRARLLGLGQCRRGRWARRGHPRAESDTRGPSQAHSRGNGTSQARGQIV